MAKLRPALVLDTRIRGGVSAPREVLTGLDVFHGHIFLPIVLIYNKGFDIEHAQRGLKEALRLHPLVGGRLKRDEEGHACIQGDDSGIIFRVYQCEGKLPYGPGRPLGKDAKLFCKTWMPWQIINRDVSLVVLELYRFDCGGILMACSVLHSFFDGTSFAGFMHNWSRACLGHEVKPPASGDRSMMIRAGGEAHDAAAYELMVKPPLITQVGIVARLIWRAVTQMRSEVFRIPSPAIQQWKAQARAALPEDARVSDSQLATAYIMRAISPALPRGIERSVGLVLDLRLKRSLGLPRDYVGNALCWGEARYSEEDLAHRTLPELADRCRPQAEQLSSGALIKLLAVMEAHRQTKRLWRLMFRPVIQTLRAGLIQNNMSLLPIYEIDLGNGRPDWFDMAPMTIRMAVLVPSPGRDGGLDVHLTARRAERQALRARLHADGIVA